MSEYCEFENVTLNAMSDSFDKLLI